MYYSVSIVLLLRSILNTRLYTCGIMDKCHCGLNSVQSKKNEIDQHSHSKSIFKFVMIL